MVRQAGLIEGYLWRALCWMAESELKSHISRTTELTKSNLIIYVFTLSVGLKYDVVQGVQNASHNSQERETSNQPISRPMIFS